MLQPPWPGSRYDATPNPTKPASSLHLSAFRLLAPCRQRASGPGLCDIPDGQRGVPGIPPLLGGADVHAPQLPAVPVGRVLVTLHLKVVLLDVVYGGENDPSPIFLNSGKYRLCPEWRKTKSTGKDFISPIICRWTL